MKLKKTLAIMLMLVLAVTLAGCGGGTDEEQGGTEGQAQTEEKGTLIVGTSPDFAPFEYVDEATGEMTGFDLELIKAVAEDQGYTVEYTSLGFDGLVPAVQTGNIDVVASGCTIRDDQEGVSFTDGYITAGLALLVREDDTAINSVDDLQGKTAAVQIATTGYEEAQRLVDEGVLADITILNTVDLVMQELINGAVDCVINDLPVAEAYMAAQPGNVRMVGEPLTSEDYGFIVAADNTQLLEELNQGLKNVQENGTYDQLLEKYF